MKNSSQNRKVIDITPLFQYSKMSTQESSKIKATANKDSMEKYEL